MREESRSLDARKVDIDGADSAIRMKERDNEQNRKHRRKSVTISRSRRSLNPKASQPSPGLVKAIRKRLTAFKGPAGTKTDGNIFTAKINQDRARSGRVFPGHMKRRATEVNVQVRWIYTYREMAGAAWGALGPGLRWGTG